MDGVRTDRCDQPLVLINNQVWGGGILLTPHFSSGWGGGHNPQPILPCVIVIGVLKTTRNIANYFLFSCIAWFLLTILSQVYISTCAALPTRCSSCCYNAHNHACEEESCRCGIFLVVMKRMFAVQNQFPTPSWSAVYEKPKNYDILFTCKAWFLLTPLM